MARAKRCDKEIFDPALLYGRPSATSEEERQRELEHIALISGAKYENDNEQEEEAEIEFKPWDSTEYGSIVKEARIKAGYMRAEDFGRAVYRRTRIFLSRDVMYKIEQGRQDPTVEQFMAINLTLFYAPVPSRVTMPCICSEWMGIAAHNGDIPHEWKEENTKALEEQTGQTFATPEAAAETAKDIPAVFA